ncbi:hypothetical protein D3C81_2032110 [compost metagenome]
MVITITVTHGTPRREVLANIFGALPCSAIPCSIRPTPKTSELIADSEAVSTTKLRIPAAKVMPICWNVRTKGLPSVPT